ncbi:hypothetical protein ABL78_8561 [Leptomonas seymouri]|uniref:Secreted protein n=1 Tax=Leptomonas seymouri TaxID=5684 RepID=A0A0N0P218_LEPSE|nr:hypothetical protein ABL78_8561 [Leptomonas seymouri]|eukprot:KPI82429.1 hypothetical protein ABL78_8561 [Leptomonas seymouri]
MHGMNTAAVLLCGIRAIVTRASDSSKRNLLSSRACAAASRGRELKMFSHTSSSCAKRWLARRGVVSCDAKRAATTSSSSRSSS